LTAFHKDLLSFRLDVRQGIELIFKSLASSGRIKLDIILLALMFDNHYGRG